MTSSCRSIPLATGLDNRTALDHLDPASYAYLHNSGQGYYIEDDDCDCLDINQPDIPVSGDGEYTVRVKAQVMMRDDSTGGWVPMGGGGMSIIGLRKLDPTDRAQLGVEYLIQGQRIADHAIVLNCPLKRDLQYTKANPTFHHWQTGSKRFGLTFQSSADAFAFEKSIYKAVATLQEHPVDLSAPTTASDDVFVMLHFTRGGGVEGLKDSLSQSTSLVSLLSASKSSRFVSPSTIRDACHRAAGLSSDSLAIKSTRGPRTLVAQRALPGHMRINVNHKLASVESEPSRDWSEDDNDINRKIELLEESIRMSDDSSGLDSSYVRFAKTNPDLAVTHDYCYPTLSPTQTSRQQTPRHQSPRHQAPRQQTSRQQIFRQTPCAQQRDTVESPTCRTSVLRPEADAQQQLHGQSQPASNVGVELPTLSQLLPDRQQHGPQSDSCSRKADKKFKKLAYGQRAMCTYCHEVFVEGISSQCPDAPSRMANCIEVMSCTCAAHALLYHCTADPEGSYNVTCSCASKKECRKWTLLALLSLFLPCLCLYYPMLACHRCAVGCGFCVGRHKAM